MKHCLKCYRLIENDTNICPYCGTEQDYSTPADKYAYKKCPRCFAYLYDEEKGCQHCGYRKKSRPSFIIYVLIALLVVMLVIIFLLFH